MTLHVTHLFVSPKSDGPDSTLVRPSAASGGWNADHKLVTDSTTPIVLGRQSAGAGAIEELPISVIFPAGVIVPYAGAAAPAGWLLCYGQSLIQADYPALFAVIGQTYGAGPGPSTFLLPDLRGAAVGGKSNMGGADRGNLPGGATLGHYIGASSVGTLGVSVSVNVGQWYGGGTFGGSTSGAQGINITTGGESSGVNVQGGGLYAAQSHTHAVNGTTNGDALSLASFGATGGGTGATTAGFNIIQPTVVLNYIIKI